MNKQNTKVSVVARQMMAQERDRIARRKRKQISPIEQSAIVYLRKQEEKQRKEKEELLSLRGQQQPAISFQALTEKIVEEKKQNKEAEQDKAAWKQFNPWQDKQEEKVSRKPNSASIWLFARKMMACEWALALGKPRNMGLSPLEQSAADWQKVKNTERLKIELAERMFLLANKAQVMKGQLEELRARQEDKMRQLMVQRDWTKRRVNA